MYVVRKGWKPITSGHIYDLYIEIMDRARVAGHWPAYKPYPPLYSRKSCSTLGVCTTNWEKLTSEPHSTICLSEVLFNFSDNQIRKTICHEVAHAAFPRDHHGYYWYTLANFLGGPWGLIASRVNDDEELNKALIALEKTAGKYKYELYCPTCGATWKYKCKCAAVQNPSRYRCTKDKTKLLSRAIVGGI